MHTLTSDSHSAPPTMCCSFCWHCERCFQTTQLFRLRSGYCSLSLPSFTVRREAIKEKTCISNREIESYLEDKTPTKNPDFKQTSNKTKEISFERRETALFIPPKGFSALKQPFRICFPQSSVTNVCRGHYSYGKRTRLHLNLAVEFAASFIEFWFYKDSKCKMNGWWKLEMRLQKSCEGYKNLWQILIVYKDVLRGCWRKLFWSWSHNG